MSRPLAAGQPSTAVAAAKPNVIAAAPVRYAHTNADAATPRLNPVPIPFAGPFPTLGTPPPPPFYPMGPRPPSAFPPVMPPGTFPGPPAYPPPPPPPGVPGPYPGTGTPSPPSVDPRYITQYPVCPGPPGFPPSLIYPPPIAPPDIPHFKVYIGRIAPTVDYNFVISLLQVCGVVKSWKPVRNPLDGTHTGFGFCEFESAEGCLRARRLLNKLSVDGQELVLSVDQATRHVPFKYSAADKDAMERIHSMIEERMKNKLPRSPTPAVQVSACTVDDNANDDARSSELEERKIRKQCEKEEHLGGRKAVGSQGKKDREVTAAGKSSLRIDAAPSMHVPMERESTVEHKRKSQHRKRGGFRKSNGEEKGRERKTVGSEGRKDREVTAAGKSSLQIDEESLMHVRMERESAVEHERKNQHKKRDGFRKSNGEEKGRERKTVGSEGRKDREVAAAGMSSLQIDVAPSMHVPMERESAGDGFPKSNGEENRIVFVPDLISDKQNISAGEKVGFELQATSNSVDKKTLDAKQLHATVPKMIEERMKSKLSGSPTPAVQVSACIVDVNGDDDTGRSSLEERKIRRQCEEEEPLGERKAVGPKGWKDREVTAARMSSLQIDVAPSMHVPMERESAGGGFRKSNSEEKGRERITVGSEGRKDREVTAAGKSSLQIDEAPLMHVRMEREYAVELERKNQHRKRDGFRKSNGEEQGRERKAIGSEGQKDREVAAAGMSSLQIVVVPSIHVPREQESAGDGFPKSNDEEKGRERKAAGSEGRKDREMAAAGMSSLQIDVAPSMHVPMERESAGDGFPKSNAEEKRIVFVPGLVSDNESISVGEKVGFDLQATSKSGDHKPLDAKQLLATVPKMKEELFAHDVNWAIYDKYGLHERMRPWISKKATEVFGEELAEFVDYVVASTKEHVNAPRMLELLESLLDDDAEKFVLLMWRKLIFEIKRVEEGLA